MTKYKKKLSKPGFQNSIHKPFDDILKFCFASFEFSLAVVRGTIGAVVTAGRWIFESFIEKKFDLKFDLKYLIGSIIDKFLSIIKYVDGSGSNGGLKTIVLISMFKFIEKISFGEIDFTKMNIKSIVTGQAFLWGIRPI